MIPSPTISFNSSSTLINSPKTLNTDMLNGETETVDIVPCDDPRDQVMGEMEKLRSLNLPPKK